MSTVHLHDSRLQQWGIGLLRIALGTIFAIHGAQKLFEFGFSGTTAFFGQLGLPLPAVSAALVIAAELGGGVALLVGLGARLAALPLAVTMVVAMLTVHLPGGFFLPDGIEFTLALLAGLVALALAGPGAWALDNVLWRPGHPLVAQSEHDSRPERRLRKAA